jgi:hypothetical protein
MNSAGKRLLIVGLDPGVTVGYALLDTSGNLVAVGSKKELSLDNLVKETSNYGRAILVGSDRAKAPGLVHEFAAKFGARIILPDKNLSARQKGRLAKDYVGSAGASNEHEIDALASAVFAFKKIRRLLDRIARFTKSSNADKVIETVIKKKIAIKKAVALN